jgi:hypothetical protein
MQAEPLKWERDEAGIMAVGATGRRMYRVSRDEAAPALRYVVTIDGVEVARRRLWGEAKQHAEFLDRRWVKYAF